MPNPPPAAAYAARAQEWGLSFPDGLWMKLDGLYHYGGGGRLGVHPGAEEAVAARLPALGDYFISTPFHPGSGLTLSFVGPEGGHYAGRTSPEREAFLAAAGYRKREGDPPPELALPALDRLAPEHFKDKERAFESEDSLLHQALGDLDAFLFEEVLPYVEKERVARMAGGLMFHDAYQAEERAPRQRALADRLMEVGVPADRLLLNAMEARGDNRALVAHLLEKGASPFGWLVDGQPLFLGAWKSDEMWDHDRARADGQSCLVLDAILRRPDLDPRERRFYKAVRELFDPERQEERYGRALFRHVLDAHRSLFGAAEGRLPATLEALAEPYLHGNAAQRRAFWDGIYVPAHGYLTDPGQEFVQRVVLPQALVAWSEKTGVPLGDGVLKKLDAARLSEALLPDVQRVLHAGRSLDKITGLAHAWHDRERNGFPDVLLPLAVEGSWEPLTETKAHPAPNGFSVHVLTTDEELKKEGSDLSHCVGWGSYGSQCLAGKRQILSVRDPGGLARSTAEVSVERGKLVVHQHRALHNAAPGAAERAALDWFRDAYDAGRLDARPWRGETEASRRAHKRPLLLRAIGYELAQPNVEAAFAEYKEPRRRAYECNPETHAWDRQSRRTDFIAGSAEEIGPDGRRTGKSLRLHDLSAREWFRASGLREKALAVLDRQEPLQDAAIRAAGRRELAAALVGAVFPSRAPALRALLVADRPFARVRED
ncbi:MAG: PcfJ domain-containing protein [Verrucomicrobium sp.]|nr:PcfJ domain-containing protein [Verrucomicrobium sp.]